MNIDNDKLKVGYDPASPDGDYSALTLSNGGIAYTFVGYEADFLLDFLAAQRQALRDEVEKAIVSFIHPSVATTPEAQKAINTAISTIFEGKEQPNE